jgi:hydrogen cyanide synthase HcnA
MRVEHSNTFGMRRSTSFTVTIDGEIVKAYAGETAATVLLASGRLKISLSKYGQSTGVFCGMGICGECLVTFNNEPSIRACRTLVQPGDRIETQNYINDTNEKT